MGLSEIPIGSNEQYLIFQFSQVKMEENAAKPTVEVKLMSVYISQHPSCGRAHDSQNFALKHG